MNNRYLAHDSPMLSRRSVLKAMLGVSTVFVVGNPFWSAAVSADAAREKFHHKRFIRPPDADHAGIDIATPFGDAEIAILTSIVEAIVPTDGTAGAREVGSAEFVLATVRRTGEAAIAGARQALSVVDQIAWAQYGRGFATLVAHERDIIVGVIATEPSFALFWDTVRSLTVLHFYAQPEGYRPLGLPGPNIDRGGYPHADARREHGCVEL